MQCVSQYKWLWVCFTTFQTVFTVLYTKTRYIFWNTQLHAKILYLTATRTKSFSCFKCDQSPFLIPLSFFYTFRAINFHHHCLHNDIQKICKPFQHDTRTSQFSYSNLFILWWCCDYILMQYLKLNNIMISLTYIHYGDTINANSRRGTICFIVKRDELKKM